MCYKLIRHHSNGLVLGVYVRVWVDKLSHIFALTSASIPMSNDVIVVRLCAELNARLPSVCKQQCSSHKITRKKVNSSRIVVLECAHTVWFHTSERNLSIGFFDIYFSIDFFNGRVEACLAISFCSLLMFAANKQNNRCRAATQSIGLPTNAVRVVCAIKIKRTSCFVFISTAGKFRFIGRIVRLFTGNFVGPLFIGFPSLRSHDSCRSQVTSDAFIFCIRFQ